MPKAAIAITSARYLTPSGQDINHTRDRRGGIAPDVVVEATEQDWVRHNDVQLRRALALMHQRRHIADGDPENFRVRDLKEVTDIIGTATGVLTAFLSAIAAVSLVVGGIGIMNIMLASILERTREIGVRRALGARRTDMVRQFLIETVLISFVGGTIGVIAGVGISQLIGFFAGWSTIVTASSILLAFVVSVSVGLVFGLYPARRAARLDVAVALQHP